MADIDPLNVDVRKDKIVPIDESLSMEVKSKEVKSRLERKIDSLIEGVTELTRIVGGLAKNQGNMADKMKAGRF